MELVSQLSRFQPHEMPLRHKAGASTWKLFSLVQARQLCNGMSGGTRLCCKASGMAAFCTSSHQGSLLLLAFEHALPGNQPPGTKVISDPVCHGATESLHAHAVPTTLAAFACAASLLCWWQDLHALAKSCCTAAGILHRTGLVHRDIRLPNVVQLGPLHYILIDLESAAPVSSERLSADNCLRTCTTAALDQGRFTTASDMYCIGKVLQEARPLEVSQAAVSFIDNLVGKRLTAVEALHELETSWVVAVDMQTLSVALELSD